MLIVVCAFLVLLFMGMPVAFAIGISGVLFFLQNPNLPWTIPVQLTVTQTQNFALLAIPLFIVAGNVMNVSGITARLLRLSTVLTGHMRGGLGQVSIAMATLMGSVSGSAIADAAMQSRVLGFEMLKRGFSKGYASAIIAYGSLITPIIPPGIGYILYGTVGQVSIGRLFAAGIVPGFLLWLAMSLTVAWTARRHGVPAERDTAPTPREIGSAALLGLWAILFPVFLIIGLRIGVFTPSEIGAFAVVYAFLVGLLAYRELTRTTFLEALDGSVVDVGAVMFLIALSGIFAYGIVYEQIPDLVSGTMLGLTENRHLVILLMVLFLLAAGCFIDGSVLIIMLTPIFLPIATELGFDPVHFGVVFIISVTIGNFTPPVGAAMYAVCSILNTRIGDYTRESVPFLAVVAGIAIVLIFVPEVVMFVPDLLFGR